MEEGVIEEVEVDFVVAEVEIEVDEVEAEEAEEEEVEEEEAEEEESVIISDYVYFSHIPDLAGMRGGQKVVIEKHRYSLLDCVEHAFYHLQTPRNLYSTRKGRCAGD